MTSTPQWAATSVDAAPIRASVPRSRPPRSISTKNGLGAMTIVENSSDPGFRAGPSRRAFLEGIGTSAFLLAFQLPASVGRAGEPPALSGQFNAFLAIDQDDMV